MSPSNDQGYPGMEHTRTGKSTGSSIHVENPETCPAGTTRADRAAGLEAAMEIAKTNNFNFPLEWAIVAADTFAKFIHDGTVDKDPFSKNGTKES